MSTEQDAQELELALRKLNERAWGWAFGLLLSFGLFFATVFLVLKGGVNMGQHLSLLGIFLPGYRVSWAGAFIGFVYMFVIGYGLGRLVGSVYNRLVG
ncbi:MAG: hypothetical protein R3E10_01780 [Gemmatimonadota bacterium]